MRPQTVTGWPGSTVAPDQLAPGAPVRKFIPAR